MLASLTKRQRILLLGSFGLLGLVVIAVSIINKPTEQKIKSNVIYYEGAMINKSRTMLVDGKGNIIKMLDPNRPDKDGTALPAGADKPTDVPDGRP